MAEGGIVGGKVLSLGVRKGAVGEQEVERDTHN